MRYACTLLGGLGLLVVTFGCNNDAAQTSSTIGTVAIIDLDAIAKEMGVDKMTIDAVSAREKELKTQLAAGATVFKKQLDAKRRAIEENPTDELKRELLEMEQEATQKLTEANDRAIADLQQFRHEKLEAFRKRVRPIAREIAQGKGMSIIITRNESIYDVASSVDITQAVVSQMKQGKPAASVAGKESVSSVR